MQIITIQVAQDKRIQYELKKVLNAKKHDPSMTIRKITAKEDILKICVYEVLHEQLIIIKS